MQPGEEESTLDDLAGELLDLACLHYGVPPGTRAYAGHADGPGRRRRAAQLLERYPELARHSLHTAAVCGDREGVDQLLAERPGAVHERGGREGWEPLLFLCYGRLPGGANAVEIAAALLDHGADPDVAWSYDWEGRPMPWSALCGVIGDGEAGPINLPPHPQADELAALLLERGASPNQSQALYNTMLRGDDPHWLEVLIARGLGPRDPVLWEGRDSATSIFQYLLGHAVDRNQRRRATVLLEHGANPNGEPGRDLHRQALLAGNLELAELLARHGAIQNELQGVDAFRAACLRADLRAGGDLLAAHPEYRSVLDGLLHAAAARDLVEVARWLLDAGASPDAKLDGPGGDLRALHQAAHSNATAVAALLLERGADAEARDGGHQATPLAWAIHSHAAGTIALLGARSTDVFTLTAGAQLDRLRSLLEVDRDLANATATQQLGLGEIGAHPGDTPLFVLPPDETQALKVAQLLLGFGADPERRNAAGQTAAEKARARDMDDVADVLAAQ